MFKARGGQTDENRELTAEQAREAFKKRTRGFAELTEKELAENPEAAGACCYYVSGYSECKGDETEQACKNGALGVYYKRYEGQGCSSVSCPP